MKKIGVLAGLAAVALACGGGGNGEAGAADTTPAAAPAAPAAGATHDVNMVLEGTAYKFVPADLTVKVGDKVVFHNWRQPAQREVLADSIPAGGKDSSSRSCRIRSSP
jgi:plastocyanin